ncbi:hypothetical protein [Enterococcus phoeniculicola]|uniref:Uncharacterized protein n=1 Tax=Enterococcus phoeniculicola ATCC BAA-412 TaxID=1158610 RepID=R3TPM2_9ENTE|nr:hypothetical protein [Enterococcus phoeniculicola]EOL42998.1 hypothetical protein UC3_01975 [Enterococcus phoeniculicola ATCC BAA-412]EOT76644.1 hypothetical protein I589_01601 [Enterococcus phoeniculicola ATCC BAA-412]
MAGLFVIILLLLLFALVLKYGQYVVAGLLILWLISVLLGKFWLQITIIASIYFTYLSLKKFKQYQNSIHKKIK